MYSLFPGVHSQRTEPGLTMLLLKENILSDCRRLASGSSAIRAVDQASVVNADGILISADLTRGCLLQEQLGPGLIWSLLLIYTKLLTIQPFDFLTIRNNTRSEGKEVPVGIYHPRKDISLEGRPEGAVDSKTSLRFD